MEWEVNFTETTVSYFYGVYPYRGEDRIVGFTGTYVYYPPTIIITESDGTEYEGEVREGPFGGIEMFLQIRGASCFLFQDVAKP